MKSQDVSLLLAGDALITRPWSDFHDANFLALIEHIRSSDVAIANLETVIHEFKGHPQADAGGVYMASSPEIAGELKWAGFNMLAHANNHAFDYGVSGIMETIEHVEREGLIIAGSGKDLQSARAPRYFKCKGGTVALVAMASDFVAYGRASPTRPDVHGRPGVNPLAIGSKHEIALRPLVAAFRSQKFRELLLSVPALIDLLNFQFSLSWGRCAQPHDLNANLDSITDAASNAEIVIVSIHAHRQGRWLETFARQVIDRGAHVVFIHGPHQVRGIELYRGYPIFYSLGDFVFELEYITRLPAESYERVGLAADASLNELRELNEEHTAGLSRDRSAFEAFVALISFTERGVSRIKLFAADLDFDSEGDTHGRPRLASPEIGRRIIGTVAARSRRFGTRIEYEIGGNFGEVMLG